MIFNREREKNSLCRKFETKKEESIFFFSLSLFSLLKITVKKKFSFFSSPLENKRDSFFFLSPLKINFFFFRLSLCFLKIRRGIEEIFVCFSLSIENSKEKRPFFCLLKNSKGKKKGIFLFFACPSSPLRRKKSFFFFCLSVKDDGEKNFVSLYFENTKEKFFSVFLVKITEEKISFSLSLSLEDHREKQNSFFLSLSLSHEDHGIKNFIFFCFLKITEEKIFLLSLSHGGNNFIFFLSLCYWRSGTNFSLPWRSTEKNLLFLFLEENLFFFCPWFSRECEKQIFLSVIFRRERK